VGDALKGLFITPERFQAILSLLKAKKNMILQGPVLPENAYRLIFLIFFGEVANLEFPAIMVPK
jgi:hypothetical protein